MSEWLKELERLYAPHPVPGALRAYLSAAAHANPSLSQAGFRLRNDDGSQTGATWAALENTNATLNVDTNYRVRFVADETAGGSENNLTPQLQYNLNVAGWNNVNAASAVVRTAASPNLADGENTTRQLASGSGTFIASNSGVDEGDGIAGQANDIDFLGGELVEVEFCFQILSADVANNDSLQLRIIRSSGTVLEGYAQTPTITVSEAGATDLVVQNGQHGQSFESIVLTQEHDLIVSGADQAQAADALVLTQVHELAVVAAAHDQAADSVVLAEGSTSLTVAAADQAQEAGALALTQTHELAVGAADHGHTAEGIAVTQVHQVQLQDSGQASVFDGASLTQNHQLALAGAEQPQSAESPVLDSATLVVAQDVAHAHAASTLDLAQIHFLALTGATHGHEVDAIILAQVHELAAADLLHAMLADEPGINSDVIAIYGFGARGKLGLPVRYAGSPQIGSGQAIVQEQRLGSEIARKIGSSSA